MADPNSDFTDEDIAGALGHAQNAGPSLAVANINANPDEGAKALQLSSATDVPAPVVYANTNQFADNYKSSLAAEIIRNDPDLNDYVRSHPLASVVSNDDYGALSEFSKASGPITAAKRFLDAPEQVIGSAVKGAEEGFASADSPTSPLGQYESITANEPAWMGPFLQLNRTLLATASAPIGVLNAIGGGISGLVQGAVKAPFDIAGAKEPVPLRRDISGMLENTFMGGAGHMPEITDEVGHLARLNDARIAAKPWVDAGLEPPRGVHPLIDEIKAATDSKGLDDLDTALGSALSSKTLERSPEMFRSFAERKFGSQTVGISADAIDKLYGDKTPSPDDGLLGSIPDIEDKINFARETGDDVHIPIKDLIIHTTPELRAQLRPDTRLWSGGITEREAAEPPVQPINAIDSPLAQVRSQGLEPMFSWGDRKIDLVRDAETEGYNKQALPDGEGDAYHEYKMQDQDGKDVGQVTIVPDEATKTLHVQMISGEGGMWANSFGPSLVRSLKRQLKGLYPDFEWLAGHRVTGARELAGTTDAAAAFPKVKLDAPETQDSFNETRNVLTGANRQQLHPVISAVKAHVGKILGREPTFDDIFKQVSSGELAKREDFEPINRGAFKLPPKAENPEVPPEDEESYQARLDNLRANAVGLDSKTFKNLQDLLNERYQSDIAASLKTAEKEQARTQTKEWKDNRKDTAKEVESTIRQRPDVAADLFVGSGELNGGKVRQRIPLAAGDLTDEQKASLPDHYYAKSGTPVDSVASMFGFGSGDELVKTLADYNAAKGELTPQEMLKQLIDTETDRQMAAKYGSLDQNIATDAHDQALSENELNLLGEEYQSAAMMAKVSVVGKDEAKAQALEMFSKMNLSDVNYPRMMALVAKHSQDATKALANGDHATAVRSLQKRFTSAVMAAETRKLEKEQAKFNRLAKQYHKRVVKGVDPEYTNYIHDILQRVGMKTGRTAQDVQDQIEGLDTGTLEKFVESKTNMLRAVPVWDQLYDPKWSRPVKELTVDEFRHVNESVASLAWNSRDEMKVIIKGEKMDLDELKSRMISGLRRKSQIKFDPEHNRVGAVNKIPGISTLRNYYAKTLQMENIFNRFDHFDSKGDWNAIIGELIDGANQKETWGKEFAKRLADLDDGVDLNRTVSNSIFRDPSSGTLFQMTRKHLRAVMLNIGTASNLKKLAGGYGLSPDVVMNWVHTNATKEDFDFVRGVWDNIFKEIKSRGDNMYRSLTGGVAPDNIPRLPIDTKFGQYAGGYYPIIHDAVFAASTEKAEGLMQPGYFSAMTPNGWTKSRTRDVRALSLSLDDMPGRINQMLHDIALRPSVINASKIFYDKGIQAAIKYNYGPEIADQLVPYLEAVSGSANRMTRADRSIEAFGGLIRQNLITTLVGLNPGTVLKHAPTALITSMNEVGPMNFLHATRSMFSVDEATGESNWQFAIAHSLELQRRVRHWVETLYGASNKLTADQGLSAWRQRIMQWSSKPVALSDMISAVPTWLAKYKMEMESGSTHGESISEADRAVRRAHGSTSVTNLSAIQRDVSPWLTSLYNFYANMVNRQMETVWKAGESVNLAKSEGWDSAKKALPGVIGGTFAYAIWPAVVENMVSPMPANKQDSWAWKAAMAQGMSLASGWVGVRDFANALISGRDPQMGLLGTAAGEVLNIARDFKKNQPMSPAHAGKTIQDGATFLGVATGLPGGAVGHALRFEHDIHSGIARPKGPWGWMTGLRYGTLKNHSQTLQQYIGGQ